MSFIGKVMHRLNLVHVSFLSNFSCHLSFRLCPVPLLFFFLITCLCFSNLTEKYYVNLNTVLV